MTNNQKKPLVSCIIIFLNPDPHFFVEAIESIRHQTYPHWEILLIDDGSTNKSTQVAQDYAQRYPNKIRYLDHPNHENRGMSATRNLGFQHLSGKYVAMLDADDVWLPEKLEKQVEIMEAHPEVSLVYGTTLTWFSWTGNPEDEKRDYKRTLGIEPGIQIDPPKLVELYLTQGKVKTPIPSCCLVKKDVIDQVGGFEESFRGMFEDQAFIYKVALIAPIFIESGCWGKYRQHPDSACYVAAAKGEYSIFTYSNPAQLKFLQWFEQYLMDQKINNPAIKKALNTAFHKHKYDRYYAILNMFKNKIHGLKRRIKLVLQKLVNQFN
jgi:glycosyltransferase involved in cell wall biosynthesis